MENDCFLFKTHISFGIVSDTVEPNEISKELDLSPDWSFKKGEVFTSKYSHRIGYKPYNLWGIKTEWTILEEEGINHHIECLKRILIPQRDILKRYKEDNSFELSFSVWIETDDAGIALGLNESEMGFLTEYSNRVDFLLLVKESISM